MENRICTDCPFWAVLESSEVLAEELHHNDKEKALGSIYVMKKALEMAADKIECTGNNIDENSQIICPLGKSAESIRSYGAAVVQTQNYAIELEEVRGLNTRRNTGQYL